MLSWFFSNTAGFPENFILELSEQNLIFLFYHRLTSMRVCQGSSPYLSQHRMFFDGQALEAQQHTAGGQVGPPKPPEVTFKGAGRDY